jgi:virulence-associated protein VapD
MCYATKAAKHAFNHAQFSLYMEYWVSYPWYTISTNWTRLNYIVECLDQIRMDS